MGLTARPREGSHSRRQKSVAMEGAASVLLQALGAQLGDSPEGRSQRNLVHHCAQAAQSVVPSPETMPAELIATMLTYFMVQTVPSQTRGVAYCSRHHPSWHLVENNPRFTTIGPGITSINSLEREQNEISTAIVVVADSEAELLFGEKLLRPMVERMTSNGVDILVVADHADRARSIANEMVPSGHACWSVNFPLLESDIGLSGIALRCSSSK